MGLTAVVLVRLDDETGTRATYTASVPVPLDGRTDEAALLDSALSAAVRLPGGEWSCYR